MYISPINQHKNNSNSFQAVNQEYLQRAKIEFKQIKGVSGDLLDCLYYDVFFKKITKTDGIDTLNAIKPYVTGVKDFYEHILEVISNINR